MDSQRLSWAAATARCCWWYLIPAANRRLHQCVEIWVYDLSSGRILSPGVCGLWQPHFPCLSPSLHLSRRVLSLSSVRSLANRMFPLSLLCVFVHFTKGLITIFTIFITSFLGDALVEERGVKKGERSFSHDHSLSQGDTPLLLPPFLPLSRTCPCSCMWTLWLRLLYSMETGSVRVHSHSWIAKSKGCFPRSLILLSINTVCNFPFELVLPVSSVTRLTSFSFSCPWIFLFLLHVHLSKGCAIYWELRWCSA